MANTRTESRPLIEGPGLLQSLRLHWITAAIIMAVCAILGFGLSAVADPSYSSTARVGLTPPANVGGPAGLVRYIATVAQFTRSDAVLRPASEALKNVSISKLRSSISAEPDLAANVVFITATASTPNESVRRADAMLASLTVAIKKDVDTKISQKVDELAIKRSAQNAILKDTKSTSQQRAAAQQVLQRVEDQELTNSNEAADFGDGIDFVTKGLTPPEPGLKASATQGVLGGLVGFIIALVVCWVLADRRRVIDDAVVPGMMTDTRLLGEIPTLRGESARALGAFNEMPAASFEFAAAGLWSGIESGVLMVSGVEVGAGSTTTAANIAAAYARDGRRVVLIDADGGQRSLTHIAGIHPGTAGLSDVLTMRAPLESALRAVDLGDSTSVALLPIGQAEPDMASLLRGKSMAETIDRLREWYDLIIIDVPPLAIDAHGASLARIVDAVMFVVPRGVRMRKVERIRERLDLLNLPVLGYVFNRDHAIEVSVSRNRIAVRQQ